MTKLSESYVFWPTICRNVANRHKLDDVFISSFEGVFDHFPPTLKTFLNYISKKRTVVFVVVFIITLKFHKSTFNFWDWKKRSFRYLQF